MAQDHQPRPFLKGVSMKILITGSRTWRNRQQIADILSQYPTDSELLHGGAMGADRIAGQIGQRLGMTVTEMLADWITYGKSAGFRRNDAMLDTNPDVVLAFWDGVSKGTKYTIDEATKRGFKVLVTKI